VSHPVASPTAGSTSHSEVDPGRSVLVRRLEADGLVERRGEELRTTRRWQGAMARAAYQLLAAGEPSGDLRLPMIRALVEFYPALPDQELLGLLEVLLPVELCALDPSRSAVEASRSSKPSERGALKPEGS
jgi:hypothetical protein